MSSNSSRTSKSLQGVTPYTFPFRTAGNFLEKSLSDEAGYRLEVTQPSVQHGVGIGESLGLDSRSLSLPGMHFFISQSLAVGDMHLHALTSDIMQVDELELSDAEYDLSPISNYAGWRQVESTVVYGSGIPRPSVDPSDEEYE